MPKTLNPISVFPSSIVNFPQAGNNEPVAIGPLEAAIQAVLNRTEHLHQSRLEVEGPGVKRLRRVATLAALQNLTGMADLDVVAVDGYGLYRLFDPSALTADGLWVLSAAGGGRWVHSSYLMRGINNGWAMLDSSGRLAQDVRDGSILTQHIGNGQVTGPKLATGAAVANLGYTPVNKNGDTMTGALTVTANVGEALSLKGGSSNHVYLGFYARSANQSERSGFIGYGSFGSNSLDIVNEIGGHVYIASAQMVVNSNLSVFGQINGRYNHAERFSVCANAGSDMVLSPSVSGIIAELNLTLPAGRKLYLRRLRHAGNNNFRAHIFTTGPGSNPYLAPNTSEELSLDYELKNVAETFTLMLAVFNASTSNQTVSRTWSVWAELEIR
ncbi:hypothetical protein Mesil_1931 [Allomeiothermus silvanus DSM 9946]|uniref:Uncharacterized protein n=1 Tax=Allomeiothermus silvanus (strain ATCC 700542 / DSM 9946 / NBRC 106475 / NCIMB 13440 / VI-R2) TaxID=526227 RepID=D7BGJ0_ALLS1|nr:hypothetical protein [Allomeiothermus silvanus]ADH63806.1 hypothetical protein Mesil_1931 [Allomeiothermus silvanus DSM 9946]